jgi:hypothetical protein
MMDKAGNDNNGNNTLNIILIAIILSIAGNRHAGKLSNSAWWSSNPKVGHYLFFMETIMMTMVLMRGMRNLWY